MAERYAGYEGLKFDRVADGVLRITMSTPGRLNAAGPGMHRALAEVWSEVDRDPDTRVAIITGEGQAFSAGGDLDMIVDMADDFATRIRVLREARDIVYNLINCSKPVVSAMRGPAVGAGLVVGLLADVSIASKSARIIDGPTRLGGAARPPPRTGTGAWVSGQATTPRSLGRCCGGWRGPNTPVWGASRSRARRRSAS